MITHSIESYLYPKSNEDKVKVTNLKNLPKFQILKQTLHATHLLKLLDKMCNYEMDPTSIVEDAERTRFCPQMDRRTDGQGETSIPPFQLHWSGGYKDELDESTARRQLKSPRSLSGRSIHLTLVTKWSWSWPWKTCCHPLYARSISPPILRYSYFKIWPWKSMVKVMSWGERPA